MANKEIHDLKKEKKTFMFVLIFFLFSKISSENYSSRFCVCIVVRMSVCHVRLRDRMQCEE